MKRLALLSTIAAVALSTPADAKLVGFTISGGYAAKFRLDLSPIPLPENTVDGFLFGFGDVPGFPTPSGVAGVTFFNIGASGGILISDGFDYLVDATGPQLYTGPEHAPTFLTTGSPFTLTGLSTPGTFVVTITPLPEPATWGMMIVGFAAAGGALRDRRRTVRVASR